jgi:hypothetical protein
MGWYSLREVCWLEQHFGHNVPQKSCVPMSSIFKDILTHESTSPLERIHRPLGRPWPTRQACHFEHERFAVEARSRWGRVTA